MTTPMWIVTTEVGQFAAPPLSKEQLKRLRSLGAWVERVPVPLSAEEIEKVIKSRRLGEG